MKSQPEYCTLSPAEHHTNGPCPGCDEGILQQERDRIKDWFAVIAYHVDRTMLIDEKARAYLTTVIRNSAGHCTGGRCISGAMVDKGREVLEKI